MVMTPRPRRDALALDNRRLGLALFAFFGVMLIGAVICILVLN
jgi:hypothetical protein